AGAHAPEAQLGPGALRLDLDPPRQNVVREREHEKQGEGDQSGCRKQQPPQQRMAGEERVDERERGGHQDPCQGRTVSETSRSSLFSYALRTRRRRTRTTPGLRSMSEISFTSLSSGTLPRFTSTDISRGRPFWPPATTPRSLIPPTSTPLFRADVSTNVISAGGLRRRRASSSCRSRSRAPSPAASLAAVSRSAPSRPRAGSVRGTR